MRDWLKLTWGPVIAACVTSSPPVACQTDAATKSLNESGQVVVDGRSLPYLIHRLPVNAFPDLPGTIVDELNRRQCLIPQSYEAHHPENVVHASLERAGSSDWAVLCSTEGRVSLLVFFGDAPAARPSVLGMADEKERLQRHESSGVLGFNWAIEPASPQTVHEAQSAMEKRPPRPDHDALADITLDRTTLYRFFKKGSWTVIDTSD